MSTMREMSLEEVANQYSGTHRAAKEYNALHARVAELERERDQLALSLSATRAERDHAARSAELWESEYRTCYAAMEDYKHAWLEGRAIMAVAGYFSRMREPYAYEYRMAGSWNTDWKLGRDLPMHGDVIDCVPLYSGSAPVPAAQDFSLMQGGYCCECGHELCDTCAPLHPIMPWPAAQEVDVDAICNAYESGVGHRGRPTANVNPYRECTPEHEAYAIGAKGEAEAKVAELEARIERLREDVHTAWSTERECRERLAAIETVCRRLVARRNSEDGYTILTIDVQRLEELLADTPAATVPPAEAKMADDVVMVPKIPTSDMLLAGVKEMFGTLRGSEDGVIGRIYQAMIAAKAKGE